MEQYNQLEQDLSRLTDAGPFRPDANLRLERITHLLELLGHPERAFPVVHVGGTSGKGSTATMIAAVLTAAGYHTGLFLSPSLQILNECFQLDGRMVATSRLAECLTALEPAIARVAAANPFGRPSYFEVQVALALLLFQQTQVDVAVVEVGLGGATDATNVIPATVAVLTNIDLDHTAILGDTVAAIAEVKAGIIKPGQTVISGIQQPAAQQIVAQRCQQQEARLWQMGQAFAYEQRTDAAFDLHLPDQTYRQLRPRMPGQFHTANAACAVAAAHAFAGSDLPAATVKRGLAAAWLPGRMEVVQQQPTVVLDGAHNPAKMQAAAQSISSCYYRKRPIIVLALKDDKEAEAILPPVLARADILIVTAFGATHGWQPLPPDRLAAHAAAIRPDLPIDIVADPLAAVARALAAAQLDHLVWITGSLYLIGDVRDYWFPKTTLLAELECDA